MIVTKIFIKGATLKTRHKGTKAQRFLGYFNLFEGIKEG
jgi:hypothetical protein